MDRHRKVSVVDFSNDYDIGEHDSDFVDKANFIPYAFDASEYVSDYGHERPRRRLNLP
ncbi:hypothetical protein [Agromyces chromiiresistens]|uniref:hypothetical protein n=1 Tax=Agromyces chromiiresistens TaxID=3030835 RepID=UPI0023B8D41F|nr:hypothetical protein [Agromyces chromiiresistens]